MMTEANLALILCDQSARAAADTAIDDLCKTYSTPRCHICLENMAEATILLDKHGRLIYASSKVETVMKRLHIACTLNTAFVLPEAHHTKRLDEFIHHSEVKSLILLVGAEHDRMLLTCFRLPDPNTPNLHLAKYLITLRSPQHYPFPNWQFFIELFSLTIAEARLCQDLAEGMSLTDYSKKWHVTIGTARSQLHNVLAKTNTKRQADLLRLMYLFMRE